MQRKISSEDAFRFAIDKSGFERAQPSPGVGAGASKYSQPQTGQRPIGDAPRGMGQRFY
ncbi:hypothetical protein HY792_02295 [Candidatus Desantisbacteria bacterium]|nr:hypothetical protein [Candidatus Desantisbacteria bacterium]